MGGDGAELGLLATGGNNNLIVIEKRCAPLTFCSALAHYTGGAGQWPQGLRL